MLEGYRKLVGEGFPPGTVAFAMLGATVNLYQMFGITQSLPDTLRAIADRIEEGTIPS